MLKLIMLALFVAGAVNTFVLILIFLQLKSIQRTLNTQAMQSALNSHMGAADLMGGF